MVDTRKHDLSKVQVDVHSIDQANAGVSVPVNDPDQPDTQIAYLTREEDATEEQWQYVVSALYHALNGTTKASDAIQAKARTDVQRFINNA